MGDLAKSLNETKSLVPNISLNSSINKIKIIANYIENLEVNINSLNDLVSTIKANDNLEQRAFAFYETVFPQMERVRTICDNLELLIPRSVWPMPNYGDLLYSV